MRGVKQHRTMHGSNRTRRIGHHLGQIEVVRRTCIVGWRDEACQCSQIAPGAGIAQISCNGIADHRGDIVGYTVGIGQVDHGIVRAGSGQGEIHAVEFQQRLECAARPDESAPNRLHSDRRRAHQSARPDSPWGMSRDCRRRKNRRRPRTGDRD